jgi:hypothetical protein
MPGRPHSQKTAFQVLTGLLFVLPVVVSTVVGFTSWLSGPLPEGPLGSVFRTLWVPVPLWSYTFVVAGTLIFAFAADWFRDRFREPALAGDRVNQTLDIQDKALRAQDIYGRRLEREVREHEAAVKTHVEVIATLYLELAHLGDDRAGLAEKIRVMREIDQVATGYITHHAKSLLLLLKDESDLLFLRLPQLGIGAERAIAALSAGFHDLTPPTDPIDWLVYHDANVMRLLNRFVSSILLNTVAYRLMRDESLKRPGASAKDLATVVLDDPELVELLKRSLSNDWGPDLDGDEPPGQPNDTPAS